MAQKDRFYLLEKFDLFRFIGELVAAAELLQLSDDLADKSQDMAGFQNLVLVCTELIQSLLHAAFKLF
ncbi:MAG TPA: hypothetical protein DIW27_09870 [Cytophagales bacterium]|nr:hypothetical protein [Cytophagales bacterium]